MILEKIVEAAKILDEIEDFDKIVNENISHCDSKVSDLYHYLENNNLNSKSCYRFCKELKKVLAERRQNKQNLSIYQKYKTNCQKMYSGKENRKILLSVLYKEKKYINYPYKNRIYGDEELKEIMEG